MKDRLWSTCTNPIFLLLPIFIVIDIGWHQYTYAGLTLNTPSSSNLMFNGNFEQLDSSGNPAGWQINKSGNDSYGTSFENGYVSGKSLIINVSQYVDGDINLISPKVSVNANQTYLYKGYYYYRSDQPFELLARYYYKNGTSNLKLLRSYVNSTGSWSTVSDAFKTSNDLIAVQYDYRMTAIGTLKINGVYLEADQNVYVAPSEIKSGNKIPNGELNSSNNIDMPTGWNNYSIGNNSAIFTYDNEIENSDIRVDLSNYQNGEAKWIYDPQPVSAHQYYDFSVSYEGTVPSQVVAEYVMQDGSRKYTTLSTLMPASDWTNVTVPLEVPPGATTLLVEVVLTNNGSISTRSYYLDNMTKPGSLAWKRPLVSLTFDDGWQSAYTNGLPVLNKYGYKATYYINPSAIETSDFMNATELSSLYKSGEEIAAHGYAHDDMTSINDDALNYQLKEGRDYLRQAGFNVNDFATPYGYSDPEVQWYARQYFQTLRSTETGINTLQNFDPYNLKVLYIDLSTKNDQLENDLNEAKIYNGWLILVYHRIGEDTPPNKTLKVEDDSVTSSAFAEQIALINKSGISVLPITDAYNELRNQ